MNELIYLAGPILGCTDDQAHTWRDLVKRKFGEHRCIDPMRRDYRGIEDQNIKAIVEGDKWDIEDCDVLLANCWQVSAGTSMEIFYAHSLGKRVVAIVQPDVKVSPWITYHAEVYDNLMDAMEAL